MISSKCILFVETFSVVLRSCDSHMISLCCRYFSQLMDLFVPPPSDTPPATPPSSNGDLSSIEEEDVDDNVFSVSCSMCV